MIKLFTMGSYGIRLQVLSEGSFFFGKHGHYEGAVLMFRGAFFLLRG